MTTRLELYNGALRLCGELSLASLSEAREPRYLLDEVWNDEGREKCLEAANWDFCTRYTQLTYDTSVTPAWGHNRAFSKPTDWCRTTGMWSDEYLSNPLINHYEAGDYWYASIDQIYLGYVSKGSTYGLDLSKWPSKFASFVEAYFASQIAFKLTGKQEVVKRISGINEKGGILGTRFLDAKNLDAINSPTKFLPTGSWVNARGSFGGRRRDRGSRSNLIG